MKAVIFLVCSAALITGSCEVKSSSAPSGSPSSSASCYDEELYHKNKDNACPTDCPGMMGCDGHVYCNECEAHRNGIHIED